eukprot:356980-Chlamydomonas_euryale.AAC.3
MLRKQSCGAVIAMLNSCHATSCSSGRNMRRRGVGQARVGAGVGTGVAAARHQPLILCLHRIPLRHPYANKPTHPRQHPDGRCGAECKASGRHQHTTFVCARPRRAHACRVEHGPLHPNPLQGAAWHFGAPRGRAHIQPAA